MLILHFVLLFLLFRGYTLNVIYLRSASDWTLPLRLFLSKIQVLCAIFGVMQSAHGIILCECNREGENNSMEMMRSASECCVIVSGNVVQSTNLEKWISVPTADREWKSVMACLCLAARPCVWVRLCECMWLCMFSFHWYSRASYCSRIQFSACLFYVIFFFFQFATTQHMVAVCSQYLYMNWI